MKVVYLIAVGLHGLIHLMGFLKGRIRTIQSIKSPVNRKQGIAWLAASVMLLAYLIAYMAHVQFDWVLGFISVLISQLLIIYFWRETRFATVINVLILMVSLASFGQYQFHQKVKRETALILGSVAESTERMVTAEDVKDLPDPVRSWLFSSGMVGKPFITLGEAIQKAEMKMQPDQKNWMKASALQYTILEDPAFIWTVDMPVNSLIHIIGRDKFKDGKGEMLIKANGLINIVNADGEKLTESTLQRFLGEMVWYPSLALNKHIGWEQLSDSTARATMSYLGVTGTGTFYFDTRGNFTRFKALRFKDNDEGARRYEWILNVESYKVFEGIKIPAIMTATWKLEDRDWTWLRLEIEDIRYNSQVSR